MSYILIARPVDSDNAVQAASGPCGKNGKNWPVDNRFCRRILKRATLKSPNFKCLEAPVLTGRGLILNPRRQAREVPLQIRKINEENVCWKSVFSNNGKRYPRRV